VTSPAVIELPRRLESVSRDTFLDEPAGVRPARSQTQKRQPAAKRT
jgi:hypothetical protein